MRVGATELDGRMTKLKSRRMDVRVVATVMAVRCVSARCSMVTATAGMVWSVSRLVRIARHRLSVSRLGARIEDESRSRTSREGEGGQGVRWDDTE